VNGSVANESDVIENVSFINHSAIEVSDIYSGFDSSALGSERTVSNFEVNNFEGLTLVPLPEISTLAPQFTGFEVVDPFLHFGEQRTSVQRDTDQE
jgi:hypothetical protein